MKIAIMTQPLGTNYGGILQAWALQQVLQRMGHDVITIDRQPNKLSFTYKAKRFVYRAVMTAIGRRKLPIDFERHLPYITINTKKFITSHINMSEPFFSTKELKDHFYRENYCAVIVGSDQTWRPRYSPDIFNYFLNFLKDDKILRISYASSFGVDKWEYDQKQTIECSELANKFDFIGVRENSGVDLCRKYLGVNAKNVLDPTLLLGKLDYLELIGRERIQAESKGIFIYFLDKSELKIKISKRFSEILGESNYSCQAKHSLTEELSEIDGYIMPEVKDWLAGLANSSYVLTDSFHGMVFSIIFGKPFYVIKNIDRGEARFTSLLSACNLLDRLIDESSIDIDSILAMNISELKLDQKSLLLLKNASIEFISKSLEKKK